MIDSRFIMPFDLLSIKLQTKVRWNVDFQAKLGDPSRDFYTSSFNLFVFHDGE